MYDGRRASYCHDDSMMNAPLAGAAEVVKASDHKAWPARVWRRIEGCVIAKRSRDEMFSTFTAAPRMLEAWNPTVMSVGHIVFYRHMSECRRWLYWRRSRNWLHRRSAVLGWGDDESSCVPHLNFFCSRVTARMSWHTLLAKGGVPRLL